jgi:hypothetical protein
VGFVCIASGFSLKAFGRAKTRFTQFLSVFADNL